MDDHPQQHPEGAARAARIGVDVGGTFTDLVAIVDGEVRTAKVPSTPRDQSVGVVSVVEAADLGEAPVETIAHGTTVATNALLERRGATTALVTTEGFRDVIEIGRQDRPSLYDLTQDRPPALVPRERRVVVSERVTPEGVARPIDRDSLAAAVQAVQESGAESVAVCLLHSYADPAHEREIGEALLAAQPALHVSLSGEVAREFREYERFSTAVANAYLSPPLGTYLRRLGGRLEAAGLPAPLVMQSSGGVLDIDTAAGRASACVLSGPAGGVVGARFVAAASGYGDLLTFDMGGTSTDVAVVLGGEAQTTTSSVVAGVPIKHPAVDIHTVSAGGGSVAWADAGGALRVGPRSAGAAPGPAAYGQGGEEPTVTDADLALGYLRDGAVLGGSVTLSRELAERAIARLGGQLSLDLVETAVGIVTVAEVEMVRALRVVSVERGIDPRQLALVSFGGAGGMHACRLAEELGISTVLAPRAGGVLSALGLAVSELRRDYVAPLLGELRSIGHDRLEAAFAALEQEALEEQPGATCSRLADLRYGGQSFELTVGADDAGQLATAFAEAHDQRYGYTVPDGSPEIVNVRVVATVETAQPSLREPAGGPAEPADRRRAHFDGAWHDTPVYHRDRLGAGSEVEGPAIVEFAEATCVVRPGWGGRVDEVGTLVLERR
jgi:N-methylhydantoinase A